MIFKQEALPVATPAMSNPGDLATPSGRVHEAKGMCELGHETPLLREALDTKRRSMNYTMAEIFKVPYSHDHLCFSGYQSFLNHT